MSHFQVELTPAILCVFQRQSSDIVDCIVVCMTVALSLTLPPTYLVYGASRFTCNSVSVFFFSLNLSDVRNRNRNGAVNSCGFFFFS